MKTANYFLLFLFMGSFLIATAEPGRPKKDYLGLNERARLDKSASISKGILERKTPRFALKMNLSQLILKNLSFQFEFSPERHISVAIGYSQYLKRSLPGLFTDQDPTGHGLYNANYSGMSITPEVRFYPGIKLQKQAPHGFYIAAYLRYAKYTLTSAYGDDLNNQHYSYDLKSTYSGNTIGLMLGHQWIIAKRLSIDLWMLGGGFGKASFTLNATVQGGSIPADEQAHIRSTLSDKIQKANYLKADAPTIETTDHSVKTTMNGLPMLSLRGLGFCVGFAF